MHSMASLASNNWGVGHARHLHRVSGKQTRLNVRELFHGLQLFASELDKIVFGDPAVDDCRLCEMIVNDSADVQLTNILAAKG